MNNGCASVYSESGHSPRNRLTPFVALTKDALASLYHSRAGVVASGTATVEAAIMGTPFVMVYRVSPITYALGKPRVKVPHYAMINLIAGEEVVPELVQSKFTAENIVAELGKIIPEGEARTRMLQGLAGVRENSSGAARACVLLTSQPRPSWACFKKRTSSLPSRARSLLRAAVLRRAFRWCLRSNAAYSVLDVNSSHQHRISPPKLLNHLVAREPRMRLPQLVPRQEFSGVQSAELAHQVRISGNARDPWSASSKFVVEHQLVSRITESLGARQGRHHADELLIDDPYSRMGWLPRKHDGQNGGRSNSQ